MKYLLITIAALTLSFASFASDIITNNATNESFCSKPFYASFITSTSKRLSKRRQAQSSALKKLVIKFNNIKEQCELNGKSFSNCSPVVKLVNARKRWKYQASVKYSCL